MKTHEAIAILQKEWEKSVGDYRYQNPEKLDREYALDMALTALRAAREREKPLTVDELENKPGEPVYIVEKGTFITEGWNILYEDRPVDWDLQEVNFQNGDCYATYDCGKTWLAYRSRPKEGAEHEGNG